MDDVADRVGAPVRDRSGKVANLRLSSRRLDGVVIRPGETFSFNFRRNEIWRDVIDRRSGDRVGADQLRSNCALVKYVPSGVEIRDVTPDAGVVVADPRAL